MEKVINSLSVTMHGDEKARPIIFIHGFPYDQTMWENQIKDLTDEYYCITYDVRGFGNSYVGDGQYTMEAYVDDLFSIVHELDLMKPVLCGLSMGGYIALRTIERDQHRFGGLILLDTRSEADNNVGKLTRAKGINTINVDGLAAYVEGFVPGTLSEHTMENKKEIYFRLLETAKRHDAHGVKGGLIAMLSRSDTTHYLENITLPTLVMVGAFDEFTPQDVMKNLSSQITGSEFYVVPQAGHITPMENPDFVNEKIRDFLVRKMI